MQQRGHQPVMLAETLDWLRAGEGGVFLDLTLGGGGHAQAILGAHPKNCVFAVDRDEVVLKKTMQALQSFGDRFQAEHACFSEIPSVLEKWKQTQFTGILADLGVSSFQLDEAARGFSFRADGPLDMRMGRTQQTAASWIQETSEKEMALVFATFGEERFAARIAKHLVEARRQVPLDTTLQLAAEVVKALPPFARHGKIHPATRVFQAIRIQINAELEELDDLLTAAPQYLAPGGRLIVLSYHSLEDRLVKNYFRTLAQEDFLLPVKKPFTPTRKEILVNRRSRSCKMRVLEKVSHA